MHPPFWTSRHLDLLGCYFHVSHGHDGGDATRPVPELSKRRDCQIPDTNKATSRPRVKGKRSIAAERLAKNTWVLPHPKHELAEVLDYPASRFQRYRYMRITLSLVACLALILSRLWLSSRRVVFRFSGRAVDRFDCRVFSSRWDTGYGIHPSSVPQRFAFLAYYEITTRHCNELKARAFILLCTIIFPPGPCTGKISKLTPKEWYYDPFLVSVLISIVQEQQRHLVPPSPDPTDTPSATYTPIVLLTHWSDQDFIHLYRANMPALFLKKLDQPDYDPGLDTRAAIVHWKLSYQPYETFGIG